jgi:bifunctional non-homologous end joining protein LigD
MSTRRHGAQSFDASSEDKVFFPETGITKGDLIDYYERVAAVMLPHVRGRIVAMQRYPDGIAGASFYQKAVPDYFPDWIHTVKVKKKEGGTLQQLTIESAATLAYLADQGCIAIHVWPSRADRPHHPDRMIFDLDPSGDDVDLLRRGAGAVREVLEDVGLAAYVMTTGSRGLHVVSPLDRRADFDEVREFAALLARLLAARDPKRFTVEQRKRKRRGRVFIDCLRNAYAQHGIAPYAVRAIAAAPVATPLEWDEIGDRTLHAQRYTVRNLFRRLSRRADPWRDMARHAASLARARGPLDDLVAEADVA